MRQPCHGVSHDPLPVQRGGRLVSLCLFADIDHRPAHDDHLIALPAGAVALADARLLRRVRADVGGAVLLALPLKLMSAEH